MFALSWSVSESKLVIFLSLLLVLGDRMLFSLVFWKTQKVVILACKMQFGVGLCLAQVAL